MLDVWTHDNLSRHFMPRSDTVFQLFILLCNIVSFMFLFNWRCKIIDFIEDQQISLEKSWYEANCWPKSANANVYSEDCKLKKILILEAFLQASQKIPYHLDIYITFIKLDSQTPLSLLAATKLQPNIEIYKVRCICSNAYFSSTELG